MIFQEIVRKTNSLTTNTSLLGFPASEDRTNAALRIFQSIPSVDLRHLSSR